MLSTGRRKITLRVQDALRLNLYVLHMHSQGSNAPAVPRVLRRFDALSECKSE